MMLEQAHLRHHQDNKTPALDITPLSIEKGQRYRNCQGVGYGGISGK